MARPQKKGLDYFPLDVSMDRTNDDIEMLEAKYVTNGFKTIIKLYMRIYSDEGYFVNWCEKTGLLLAKRVNANINEVNDIINDLISWGVFDKKMHDKYKILTSKRIQKTYLEATKKRKEVTIYEEYLLVKSINDNINLINVGINPQRKEENIIAENIKVNYDMVVSSWNDLGLNQIKKLTDKRKTHIKARVDDYSFNEFVAVINSIKDSKFLMDSKDTNWFNFDWILNPNNFIKIYEGNYTNKSQSNSGALYEPDWLEDYMKEF